MNQITTTTRFALLANSLQHAGSFDEIELRDDGSMAVRPKHFPSFTAICHRLQRAINAYLPWIAKTLFYKRATVPQDNLSLKYLASVFGAARLQRICQRSGLDFGGRGSRPLTKYELEWIIPQAAEVFNDDLVELLDEIHSEVSHVRGLTDEQTATLRLHFADTKSLDSCSNLQLDRLFELLVPMAQIQHLFGNKVPATNHIAPDCGKLLQGMQERVFLYENLRRTHHTEPEWFMKLAKRLADREMPEGVVFRNPYGGYCKVHAKVIGAAPLNAF